MSQLPKYDRMVLYGPARDNDEMGALLEAVWDACKPWVEVIASSSGLSASDVRSFAAARTRAGKAMSTAIGCWFRGQGREVSFSSSRGRNARSLDLGPYVQQILLSIKPSGDAQVETHLLESLGIAFDSWFGWFSPEPEATLLMLKHGGFMDDARWKLAGPRYDRLRESTLVPALPGINLERWAHAYVPFQIGWCNYWSAQTCELLGFPDQSRDADLLATSTPLANGAWLVRLTDTPLDLRLDEHITKLGEAYRRFPEIGTP
jgi:uncharacterized protein DUF5953